MNEIKLRGYLRDIRYSHTINNVDYDKANLIVPNPHTEDDDVISLCFKHYSNRHSEGDLVDVIGNVRSYSQKISEDKNKVNIYVFTYFDPPKEVEDEIITNQVKLDGRICKKDTLREHVSGPESLSFILANNIIIPNGKGKINNYIPIVCWGKQAIELSSVQISDKISITGTLQFRTYKKQLPDGTVELKTAHEVVVSDYTLL